MKSRAEIKIRKTEYGYYVSVDLYGSDGYGGNISLHVDECEIATA